MNAHFFLLPLQSNKNELSTSQKIIISLSNYRFVNLSLTTDTLFSKFINTHSVGILNIHFSKSVSPKSSIFVINGLWSIDNHQNSHCIKLRLIIKKDKTEKNTNRSLTYSLSFKKYIIFYPWQFSFTKSNAGSFFW